MHSLIECKKIDNDNYTNVLKIVNECKMDDLIFYKNSKGNQFNNSIQQILFHVVNHFTHHRGQIISDLRQNGIDPIITDYIFYKR